MHTRFVWLVAIVALGLGAQTARACSCDPGPSDLSLQLRTARDEAVAIYRARVLFASRSAFGGEASVKVLEVFKGALKAGDMLSLPSGGGGDCSIAFSKGEEYLLYSNGPKASNVHLCTRTQPTAFASTELAWLRTGVLPPLPVAIQRERVSCTRCDIERMGSRMISKPGSPPLQWAWEKEAVDLMRAGRPFLTRSRPGSDHERFALVGRTWEGRAFELARTSGKAGGEACTQRVHLRWCKSIDVSPPESASPAFKCVEPLGETTLHCDEAATREATWLPPEALPPNACRWGSIDRPRCALDHEARALKPGAPHSPLLVCRPDPDDTEKNQTRLHCRIEQSPRAVTPGP